MDVDDTLLAPWFQQHEVYPRCQGVHVTMDSVHRLSLHYTNIIQDRPEDFYQYRLLQQVMP
jgi:hypothetical protein